jgi:hypothetical protein
VLRAVDGRRLDVCHREISKVHGSGRNERRARHMLARPLSSDYHDDVDDHHDHDDHDDNHATV